MCSPKRSRRLLLHPAIVRAAGTATLAGGRQRTRTAVAMLSNAKSSTSSRAPVTGSAYPRRPDKDIAAIVDDRQGGVPPGPPLRGLIQNNDHRDQASTIDRCPSLPCRFRRAEETANVPVLRFMAVSLTLVGLASANRLSQGWRASGVIFVASSQLGCRMAAILGWVLPATRRWDVGTYERRPRRRSCQSTASAISKAAEHPHTHAISTSLGLWTSNMSGSSAAHTSAM